MVVTRRMADKVTSVVGMRAGFGFHLERRVKHLEAFGEHGLQGFQQFFRLCAGRVHHMRRQAGLATREGPDVQVMHALYSFDGAHGFRYLR